MPNTTPNLSLYKPLVNDVTDQDLWGGYLNDNMDTLDSEAVTKTTNLNFADFELSRAKLKDTAEIFTSPAIAANAVTLNYTNGNVFKVTLDQNISTITFSNLAPSGTMSYIVLYLTQNGTGGYTVTFPASVKWAAGITPTVTSTANRTDIFTFLSVDSGTTFAGAIFGQNFTGL